MTRTMRLSSALLATSMITSCANVTKEQVGTVAGMVVGGVVGHAVGGKRGAAMGMALGGFAGNRIGAHMDEEDRKQLAALEQRALETGEKGTFVTRKTKARVSVDASPQTIEARKTFVLSEALVERQILLVDPTTITAFVDTPLYTNADEKGKPRMVIPRGGVFQVAAQVNGEPWAVVGDNMVGVGYVPTRYLVQAIVSDPTRYGVPPKGASPTKSAPPAQAKAAAPKKTPPQVDPRPQSATTLALTSQAEYDRELARLRAVYPSEQPKSPTAAVQPVTPGPAAPIPAIAVASPAQTPRLIQASMPCKVVVRTLEAERGGQPITESIKYCKEPPKGWQTQIA